MFEGLGGLTIVRNSGVKEPSSSVRDWVITLTSDHPMSFRVTAHDDGYANQSYLKFEKLTPQGWFTVVSRSGDELPLYRNTRGITDARSWAEAWDSEIDDLTLEACRLLDILGDEG
jgi:hypothetical protein